MTTLTFEGQQFRNVLQAADERNKDVYFVKDSGIYAMVFGDAGMPSENVIAYAKGFHPDDADVWERSRDAVGGDDIGEVMLSAADARRNKNGDEFRLEVTATALSLTATVYS